MNEWQLEGVTDMKWVNYNEWTNEQIAVGAHEMLNYKFCICVFWNELSSQGHRIFLSCLYLSSPSFLTSLSPTFLLIFSLWLSLHPSHSSSFSLSLLRLPSFPFLLIYFSVLSLLLFASSPLPSFNSFISNSSFHPPSLSTSPPPSSILSPLLSPLYVS